MKKKYLFIIAPLILVGLIIGAIFINKYYQGKALDKRIITFCEKYQWNDGLRNQDTWEEDGAAVASQGDFTCREHLYLKPKVKKSATGICHGEETTYYYQTKNYKIYNSIRDCLDSGGRLPYN